MEATSWHSHSFRLVCRCEKPLMPSRLLGIWIGPQNHTSGLADKLMPSGEYDGTRKALFFSSGSALLSKPRRWCHFKEPCVRIVEKVSFPTIERHLQNERTGVSLPCSPPDCTCYRVMLEDCDVPFLAVWWEFQDETANRDCRLTSLRPDAAERPRVKSFVQGNPSNGHGPVDLRNTLGREPTILTNDLASTLLYVIDGNNRSIAQHVSQRGFQDVPAYVCVWSGLKKWAYIPQYHKENPPRIRKDVEL